MGILPGCCSSEQLQEVRSGEDEKISVNLLTSSTIVDLKSGAHSTVYPVRTKQRMLVLQEATDEVAGPFPKLRDSR